MSEINPPSKSNAVEPATPASPPGKVDQLLDRLTDYINDVDEQAAAERVAALRRKNPEALVESLADQLIRHKCFRAGAVGAVTSGAAMIPGLGTFASLTFGVAADIGMTFKLQAELVLEMAALYDHTLSPDEKRRIILLVTGISAGANQVLSKVGAEIAEKATQKLAERAVIKAIPFLGVAASAGINLVSTYVIGRRAQAYFSLGPEAMQSWPESLRAISGLDERLLIDWLVETTDETWGLISRGAESAGQAVVVAARSTGKVIVLGSAAAVRAVVGAGNQVWSGLTSAANASTDLVSGAYHHLRGSRSEEEPELLEAGESPTPLDQPSPAPDKEKPGYLARLRMLFDQDQPEIPDERLQNLAGTELVGRMVKGEETVVGVVGADDDLSATATADEGFLSRLSQFFRRFWWRDDEAAGQALVEELDDAPQPVTIIVQDEDGTATATPAAEDGFFSKIFSLFRRNREEE